MLGAKLSEYHTGFRAYSRELLLKLPLDANSDDFIFDNQLLAQCIYLGARIGELSCPTHYFPEASSINIRRSMIYGLGVLGTTWECWLAKRGIRTSPRYRSAPSGKPQPSPRLTAEEPRLAEKTAIQLSAHKLPVCAPCRSHLGRSKAES